MKDAILFLALLILFLSSACASHPLDQERPGQDSLIREERPIGRQ